MSASAHTADNLPDRIRLLMKLRTAGVSDTRVLSAMESIPRELFVPEAFHDKAYEDTALPIASGQTISQPSVVAWMTWALQVGDRMRVLEIGTGSGYQAAILARLCRMLYTVERPQGFAARGRAALQGTQTHQHHDAGRRRLQRLEVRGPV